MKIIEHKEESQRQRMHKHVSPYMPLEVIIGTTINIMWPLKEMAGGLNEYHRYKGK